MSLVLRVCGPGGESHGGFRWPLTVGAEVVAPDWNDRAEYGNGLHGWLYGSGDIGVANIVDGAVWLVVEVAEPIVMLGGKCKYQRGTVRFAGPMHAAAAYMLEHEPRAKSCAVIGAVLSAGDGDMCAVGALGTATAGYRGTATAGARGTATAGDGGTATAAGSGTIVIEWYDAAAKRYRRTVGYVGEGDIEADVAYRCDAGGKLVRATP